MKWSWKIARIAGIDVYLHFTFLLLIVWIGLGYWQLEGTPEAVVSGIIQGVHTPEQEFKPVRLIS